MKLLIILIPIIGFFQIACKEQVSNKNAAIETNTLIEEITPPKKRALLISDLGDLIVALDSTNSHKEELLQFSCFSKAAPGKLEYRRVNTRFGNVPEKTIVSHNLITPPGSQYQLVLSDGTKVWLNVGSVLSYPLEFGMERKVTLAGEAYFEIEPCTWKGKKVPFRILTSKKNGSTPTVIESVQGNFNVDANGDDVVARVAVEKGVVKVTCPRDNPLADPTRIVAHEKCVAIVTEGGGITLSKNVSVQRYTNWKMYPFDAFDFYNADFKEVRGQLERWFDIKIDTSIKGERIDALMDRDATIDEVIRAIEILTGVPTKLEGRKLVPVK